MTQTTDRPQHDHDEVREVDLAITGMTCASCSARIEKKLGKLDGVDAVVNLATEKATVRYAGAVTVEDLLRTVRATGYGAEVVRGGPQRRPPSRPVPRVTYWSVQVRPAADRPVPRVTYWSVQVRPAADRPVPRVTYWSIRGRTRTTSTTPSPPRTP
jgi:copper chaperone CopZ